MTIPVTCPNPACGLTVGVAEASLGRNGRCRKCGRVFRLAPSATGTVSGDVVPPIASSAEAPGPMNLPEQFGRYRIMNPIGQGGMGVVYLAHDIKLDRPVALKVALIHPTDGPRAIRRFQREARVAATLDHPNLCPIFDVGEVDGFHYLTMPYIEGETLSDAISRDRIFAERRAVALARKLALALGQAHEKGVVHRDLKPGNVMIKKGGDLVIMDFGLSWMEGKDEGPITRDGHVLGTALYMAPEQAAGDGDATGPASDVYSLGVILYEMLTGRRPFEGPWSLVVGLKMVKDPDPPSAHRPTIRPEIDAICLKALARGPADRYPTMADLADALGAVLERATDPTPAVTGPEDHGTIFDLPGATRRRFGAIVAKAATSFRSGRHPARWWGVASGGSVALLLGVILMVNSGKGRIRPRVDDSKADGKGVPKVEVEPRDSVPDRPSERDRIGDQVLPPKPTGPLAGPVIEPAFMPLFNGRDLSGWRVETNRDLMCAVRDGEIVTISNGRLYTDDDDYRDFRLRAEILAESDCYGGIYLRSEIHNYTENAYEFIVNTLEPAREEKSGSIILSIHQPAQLFNVTVVRTEKVRPNQWFVMDVLAVGNCFTVKFDGAQVGRWVDPDDTYPSGRIALYRKINRGTGQLHFRKIEVHRLTPVGALKD